MDCIGAVNPNDPTFSADQIINHTLIAKAKVITYDLPYDVSNVVAIYQPGETVGIVSSYLQANPAIGRSQFWWQLVDTWGNNTYVPHFAGEFDVQALLDSGAMTTGQATQAAADANKSDLQKFLDNIGSYVPWLIGGVLAVALIGTVLKNEK